MSDDAEEARQTIAKSPKTHLVGDPTLFHAIQVAMLNAYAQGYKDSPPSDD